MRNGQPRSRPRTWCNRRSSSRLIRQLARSRGVTSFIRGGRSRPSSRVGSNADRPATCRPARLGSSRPTGAGMERRRGAAIRVCRAAGVARHRPNPCSLVSLRTPPHRRTCGFSPAEARFPPGTPEDYPVDMRGVPDPLDLIAVTDTNERPWLVPVSIPTWDQPQAPEIEALQAPRLMGLVWAVDARTRRAAQRLVGGASR
jgi:hypothetical protein